MNLLLLLLLAAVGVIALAVVALALTNRVVFKMAARNFARRRVQSAIVVAGLMIGTAIISASLVVGDTMRYIFEVDTYRSLGEVDHEIYGPSQFSGYQYFDEGVYLSLSENLSGVKGIQSVAPAVFAEVSVQDARTTLAEPSVYLNGYNSSIMRRTAFGDLDGKGYYSDMLGNGEVAINSRLADGLDARTGDLITVSFGVRNATNPFATDYTRVNLTVAKIIQEKELYGKANFGQRKALFLELSTAQSLMGRPGQVDFIFVSDNGDMYEGESWSPKVNHTIATALDTAVGMRQVGLQMTQSGGQLEMASELGYFPAHYASPLQSRAASGGARSMTGVAVPVMAVNGTPAGGLLVMGFNTTDPAYPSVNEGELYVLAGPAAILGVSTGSVLPVASRGLDGLVRTANLTAVVLGPGNESYLPLELQNITLGFSGPATAQHLLTGGIYPEEMLSFVNVYGVDPTALTAMASGTKEELDAAIKAKDINLAVHDVKYDGLKAARANGDSIGSIFMIFSAFSIIAGVVLIINIFVMLAEERKSEMGMARAIGMRQKHLVRMFLFEGSIYVFLASLVGAFMGLLFGYLLILAFGVIFGSGGGLNIPFYFKWDSVLTALCLGVLLTFVTIFFASRRSAKLNIIRAIRRLPEPRGSRAMKTDLVYGVAMLAFGLFITVMAAAGKLAWAWLAGPSLLFLGLGVIMHKWVSIRPAMTVSSLLILIWIFNPFPLPLVSDATASGAGLDMFIVSGIFLVLAGVLLVIFNSDLILSGLQKAVGRYKATRATLKTAISYPMDRKGRTGMTLAMFALIIFTVTVIAMIAAMQASMMENMTAQQSGGYDILAFTNPGTPLQNLTIETLPPDLKAHDIEQLETLSVATINVVQYDEKKGSGTGQVGPAITTTSSVMMLMGANDSFMDTNGFQLEERDKNYSSDRACWQALKANRSLCILDGSRMVSAAVQAGPSFGAVPQGAFVGGTVTITDMQGQNRTRTMRVIGVMYQKYFFNGLMVQKEMVKQEYAGAEMLLLLKLGPSEDTDRVSKDFKKDFLPNGLTAIDINAIMTIVTNSITSVMYLMEGFLAIGLFIGIAGIGIISYRNVIERRQQIGMMRAIGYKRRMITSTFLIETSFITILATIIGLALGLGIGWQIYNGGGYEDLGASFVIPWGNLLVIAIGAYIATLIFTFYPSIMAARVPPAEALRYIE